uniref:Uncharacterized protein n=1 Tax=Rhizophora mucronata TaxID=61149 RepID=A0A2P2K6L0_RHIMU
MELCCLKAGNVYKKKKSSQLSFFSPKRFPMCISSSSNQQI